MLSSTVRALATVIGPRLTPGGCAGAEQSQAIDARFEREEPRNKLRFGIVNVRPSTFNEIAAARKFKYNRGIVLGK
jgi:hypothetical protein